MTTTFKSLRAFWCPSTVGEARFVIATSTSFNIDNGIDLPDLTPFISRGQPVYTHRVELIHPCGHSNEFAVFYTGQRLGSKINRSVKRLCHGTEWCGDFIVFRMRKGEDHSSLVNMRKRDDHCALAAIKLYVVFLRPYFSVMTLFIGLLRSRSCEFVRCICVSLGAAIVGYTLYL